MHTILENLFLVKNCLVKDMKYRRKSARNLDLLNPNF